MARPGGIERHGEEELAVVAAAANLQVRVDRGADPAVRGERPADVRERVDTVRRHENGCEHAVEHDRDEREPGRSESCTADPLS